MTAADLEASMIGETHPTNSSSSAHHSSNTAGDNAGLRLSKDKEWQRVFMTQAQEDNAPHLQQPTGRPILGGGRHQQHPHQQHQQQSLANSHAGTHFSAPVNTTAANMTTVAELEATLRHHHHPQPPQQQTTSSSSPIPQDQQAFNKLLACMGQQPHFKMLHPQQHLTQQLQQVSITPIIDHLSLSP